MVAKSALISCIGKAGELVSKHKVVCGVYKEVGLERNIQQKAEEVFLFLRVCVLCVRKF